jgi:hypothetical protein
LGVGGRLVRLGDCAAEVRRLLFRLRPVLQAIAAARQAGLAAEPGSGREN